MANDKIIYPELSYEIIGSAFRVFNNLGYGLREDVYEKALCKELDSLNVKYEKQKTIPLYYNEEKVGNRIIDLVIDTKIVVELKVRYRLGYAHIRQVVDYLTAGNYKLAILIYFTRDGVRYRRVLNPSYQA